MDRVPTRLATPRGLAGASLGLLLLLSPSQSSSCSLSEEPAAAGARGGDRCEHVGREGSRTADSCTAPASTPASTPPPQPQPKRPTSVPRCKGHGHAIAAMPQRVEGGQRRVAAAAATSAGSAAATILRLDTNGSEPRHALAPLPELLLLLIMLLRLVQAAGRAMREHHRRQAGIGLGGAAHLLPCQVQQLLAARQQQRGRRLLQSPAGISGNAWQARG